MKASALDASVRPGMAGGSDDTSGGVSTRVAVAVDGCDSRLGFVVGLDGLTGVVGAELAFESGGWDASVVGDWDTGTELTGPAGEARSRGWRRRRDGRVFSLGAPIGAGCGSLPAGSTGNDSSAV